jgi:mannose-6-phosphate isomerase
MTTANYPLLLAPHLADRAWGGTRLGKGIGEAWDLSVHGNGPSTIRNGPLAGTKLADAVAHDPRAFGGPIDLLAKRLDCAADLSVQVHPKGPASKTEAWIVLDAEPGAGVYHGFTREVDANALRDAALDGTIARLLRFVPVRKGDAVFTPSGTVHAVGKGLFLFEIQQSADTTYRLFDWGRKGRELHVEQALGWADLDTPAPDVRSGDGPLVTCPHFAVRRIRAAGRWSLAPGPRWRAVFVEAGEVALDGVAAKAGETILLPGAAGERHGTGTGILLAYGPGSPLD